ncbi:MAG: radical SAM protein, partial [bacterium]
IVPHTRGPPYSRPFKACLREAESFVAAGFREIVVTGCNIACYRDGPRGLVDLLAALAALPGLGRLRLGSIEPGTVERDVVALMAGTPALCKFLHLPIQSGDNAVLSRMRRRYTVDELEHTLHDALFQMPNLGLGADIITGFPGESLEAFGHTRAFLEAFPFSNLHVFPYSERPGTPAATFGDAVPEPERKRRAAELIQMKNKKRAAFAQGFVGRTVEVLIEHFDKDGVAHGWTGEYLACKISGVPPSRKRQLVTCVPHAAEPDGMLLARRSPPQMFDVVNIRKDI